ncbi:testicular acid phosphatase homolog isoform X2 [Antedon mediterranea]
MYKLGTFLRNKYDFFLDQSFNENQIYVRSTDFDRTIDSANWTLKGLYPNETNRWLNDIYVPEGDDILFPVTYVCSYYKKLFEKVRQSSEYKQFVNDNQEFLKYINEEAEYNYSSLSRMASKCYDFNDAITIEISHNLTQPQWITDEIIAKSSEIAVHYLHFLFDGNIDICRLKGGPIVQLLLGNMEKKHSTRQVYMYSGHDTTLVPLSMALGIYDGAPPPPATCLGVELWNDSQNEYYVKIWYRNDSTVDPYIMSLPTCTDLCPLDEFKRILTNVLPGDIRDSCRTPLENYTLFVAIMVACLFFFCLIVMYFITRKPNHKSNDEPTEYQELVPAQFP